MTYFPAFGDAIRDEKLRGSGITVYLHLVTEHLDVVEYRPCKITGLAAALKLKRDTVSAALNLLFNRGYLDRRYVQHDGYHYRVFPVRRSLLVPLNGHTHTMV